MTLSGKLSDIKLLLALFGNVTIIEILQFKAKVIRNNNVA